MTRTDLPEDVAEEIRNRVFSESGFMKLTQVVRRRGGDIPHQPASGGHQR